MRSVGAKALACAAVVIALDQLTKALVRANIDLGEREAVFPFVDLVHVRNRGVAFGLLSDGGGLVLLVAILALCGLAAFFWLNRRRPLVWLPTGLLLGGALGNLADRVRLDAVTDFIDLPLWPSFNVADIAITFGVLSLLWVVEGPKSDA